MKFVKARLSALTKTLPRDAYCSDSVFAQERERIFARAWCAVTREERLPRTGDYVVVEIAGESLIVTRDNSGAVRAYANVCRHRGTRLCTEASGHFNGSIRCPYHAWTYGLDGSLLAARHMGEVSGFERSDYPLHEVAVGTYDGFVFVNLADDPMPFASELAPTLERFAPWNVGSLRVAAQIEIRARLQLETRLSKIIPNAITARSFIRNSKSARPPTAGATISSKEPCSAAIRRCGRAARSLTRSGATLRPPLEGLA